MLEIRLREMADWVDHFVVVEAGQTFTGLPKPFHFDAIKPQLGEMASKIIHVKLETLPDFLTSPWARECYQRDMAVSALGGLWAPGDLMLVTDADEIFNRHALEGFDRPFAVPRMRTHRYFLNYCAREGAPEWSRKSGVVCTAEVLSRFGSSYLRWAASTYKKDWNALPDAGWHLTTIDDAEAIALKFRSYSHVEAVKAGLGEADAISGILDGLRSGKLEPEWERREIDATFPLYVQERRGELRALLL